MNATLNALKTFWLQRCNGASWVGRSDEPGRRRLLKTLPKLYAELLRDGALVHDQAQAHAIGQLERLRVDLLLRHNATPSANREHSPNTFKRYLTGLFESPSQNTIPGVYLYGPPGCGKTMAMDMLYMALPSSFPKLRVHYNEFILDLHKKHHRITSAMRLPDSASESTIETLAAQVAARTNLLCIDEFQVTHITDAMLLRRLIEALVQRSTIFVMTSNRAPDKLYVGGLQRSSFLPCIETIKSVCHVVEIPTDLDHRRRKSKSNDTATRRPQHQVQNLHLSTFINTTTDQGTLATILATLLGGPKILMNPHKLILKESGRKTQLAAHVPGLVAVLDFDTLCVDNPYGAEDYIAISRAYPILVLVGARAMRVFGDRPTVRRFTTFLDAAYDATAQLVLAASVPLCKLFVDDVGILSTSLANVDEEQFAIARAASRLAEMTGSREWIMRNPLLVSALCQSCVEKETVKP